MKSPLTTLLEEFQGIYYDGFDTFDKIDAKYEDVIDFLSTHIPALLQEERQKLIENLDGLAFEWDEARKLLETRNSLEG